jgi:pyruvate/2-oxoacid:ferredoxin oxidoreductase alpha subunit
LLKAEIIEVEGENSSLGVVTGASVAGARVFTATSSWGLAFMYDGLLWSAGMRVPIVMVNVNREAPFLRSIYRGRSDIMGIRDAGWVQIEVETCQEILDSVLMAYRLAEDLDILLPVVISYDGYYLSHHSEPYDIPDYEIVKKFFLPLKGQERLRLQPNTNLDFGTTMSQELFVEYRYKHSLALERVKRKIECIDDDFNKIIGRRHGGLVATYECENAEIVLVASGTIAGTARVVVCQQRDKGGKIGLVKIRVFRPFPREKVKNLLQNRRAVGVIDCSICLGWNCGHLYMEIKSILHEMRKPPEVVLNFIDGIGSMDVTVEHIQKAVMTLQKALEGANVPDVNWLVFEE